MRKPRPHFSTRRENTLTVLEYLLSFAALLVVVVIMVCAFAEGIDRDQESHELAPSDRAGVVARW